MGTIASSKPWQRKNTHHHAHNLITWARLFLRNHGIERTLRRDKTKGTPQRERERERIDLIAKVGG